MTTTQIINQTLWNEFRESINKAYKAAKSGEDAECLRDYAENISWSDDLQKLLDRETANERQHRSNRPSIPGFSAGTAARLIIMQNAVKGYLDPEMPKATAFITWRQTAAEAHLVGFLAKSCIDPNWVKAVENFDYAKLMAA